MKLSILIVNYNVRYFLEHCLLSVQLAMVYTRKVMPGFEAEILVMDNASTDGSMDYLPAKFPSVRFIPSPENLGFSKANNRLLQSAVGEYVLFLNPDTLLPYDCFEKQLKYLSSLRDVGGCGIRMIDGTGRYLPESKRAFPDLWNSFTKMSGLAGLFPKSSLFTGYYAGSLDPRKSNPVRVLSGAYLMLLKSALDQTGGFDERFFMYAEDIDLSYRLEKAGYQNHYFAGASIIHFKGESTTKDKVYVERFYGAMILFVRKHFRGAGGRAYLKLLELAVRGHALLTSSSKETGAGGGDQGPENLPAEMKLAGDTESRRKLEEKLGSSVRIVSPDKNDDNKGSNHPYPTVFCLGPTFSHKELIRALEGGVNAPVLIYHPEAGAIIGSQTKMSKGSVYIL